MIDRTELQKRLKKLDKRQIIQVIIRLIFFFAFPGLFATAFSGAKYIAAQLAQGSAIEWNTFVQTLVLLVVITILFGRYFCGFACAFGSYGDFIYEISRRIQKKRKKNPLEIPEKFGTKLIYLKYAVLLAVLAACFLGYQGAIGTHSPWTAFSKVQQLNFSLDLAGVILFLLITVGMFFEKRFFCRFLCPMGAIFSLLPVLPCSTVKRDRENCYKGCQACYRNCPAKIQIADIKAGDGPQMGECFACGKCRSACPKKHIQK